MKKKQIFYIVLGALFVLLFAISLRSLKNEFFLRGKEPEKAFFDVNSLASFYECNQESFELLLEKIEKNETLFCIDIWRDSVEISSHQMEPLCKDDILDYDDIIFYMGYLGVMRIDYYNQDPTQVVFYFASTSDAWSLYIIYGQDIERSGEPSFTKKYIDLGDSWLALGVFCGI